MNPSPTKITPAQPGRGTIVRPELLVALQGAAASPLTLLVAPAGGGKTTLLAQWAAHQWAAQETGVAWLALDPQDNDPARFWAGLLAALRVPFPDLAVDLPAGGARPGDDFLARGFALLGERLAGVDQPVYLVLDNFQHIQNDAIHAALGAWADCLPPNLHVVIAARSEPPLPLPALRDGARVAKISAEQLQFSLDEVGRCLAGGPALSEQQLGQVLAVTGGSPAGVQLLALKRQRHPNQPLTRSGGRRELADIAEEVLDRLPEALVRFITAAAVLDTMQAEVCAAITSTANPAAILEQVEAADLFVNRVGDGYQFQPFFREALLDRLFAKERISLHRRAANRLAQMGEAERALLQALPGEDWELAARLVVELAEGKLAQGEVYTLQSWLQRFPEAVRLANPGLQVVEERVGA